MPYQVKLSRTVVDLVRHLYHVRRGSARAELVGVGSGCQQPGSLADHPTGERQIARALYGRSAFWAHSCCYRMRVSVADVLSLAIATLSLVVSGLAYRASGPRLVMHAYMDRDSKGSWQIVLEVQSRSRAVVPFDVYGVDVSGWYGSRQLRESHYKPTFSGRHPLPYRIPPWEREVWSAPANQIHEVAGSIDIDYVVLRARSGSRRRRVRVQPAASPEGGRIPLT